MDNSPVPDIDLTVAIAAIGDDITPELSTSQVQIDGTTAVSEDACPSLDISLVEPRARLYSDSNHLATWSIPENTNIGAIDFDLDTTIFEWAQLPHPDHVIDDRSHCMSDLAGRENHGIAPEDQLRINETYRDVLSSKLQTRPLEGSHLSVSYLNLCVRLYFSRFHPIFPVLHAPTFRPNAENMLLFLSMCSIGSLFLGPADASAQGRVVFFRLHKAILAAWETHLSGTKYESLSMVQAALLGQTYALLSGHERDFNLVDTFHGTMLAWARRVGAFPHERKQAGVRSVLSSDPTTAWAAFVHEEHISRLEIALHIHDAELANMCGREPLLRHDTVKRSYPLDDALFEAPTAEVWILLALRAEQSAYSTTLQDYRTSLGLRDTYSSLSTFACYGFLENIHAIILEHHQEDSLGIDVRCKLTNILISWQQGHNTNPSANLLDSEALWHACFLMLCSEDGYLAKQRIYNSRSGHMEGRTEGIQAWAESRDGARSLAHACLLQEQVGNIPFNKTPSIHVPRCLFYAGLVFLDMARYANSWERNLDTTGSPELHILDSRQRCSALKFVSESDGRSCLSRACDTINLLVRTTPWGISKGFSEILASALRLQMQE